MIIAYYFKYVILIEQFYSIVDKNKMTYNGEPWILFYCCEAVLTSNQ